MDIYEATVSVSIAELNEMSKLFVSGTNLIKSFFSLSLSPCKRTRAHALSSKLD